jgi:hypothetical protein
MKHHSFVGHARRFGRRSMHRFWRPVDWKSQYNHLNRHYRIPWEPFEPRPTDDIDRIVTRPGEGPGNPGLQPNVGGPDASIMPASAGGSILPQIGNIYCAICCRVPWYYYNNCIRRFCASRPNCPPFG